MDSDNIPETSGRNWAYIFSPFIVSIVLLLCLTIYEYATVRGSGSKAYVTLFVMVSFPYALITFLIDRGIKSFLKNKERKAAYIWIVESILVVSCLIFFYFYFKAQL